MINIANGLSERGVSVTILCFVEEGPLRTQLDPSIPCRSLGTRRLRWVLPRLIGALRRLRPGAVVSTLGYVNLALLAARPLLPRGTRLIVREANLPSQALSGGRYAKLISLGMRWLYPTADRVVASSERMSGELMQRFSVASGKLATIGNPVDAAAIRSTLPPTDHTIPDRPLQVAAAGRLTHQKGFDRLIRAVAQLRRPVVLTILGEGAERNALADLARDAGVDLDLPGTVAPPWPRLAVADVFVLSSRWEGLPNIVLEALVCGVPIIAMRDAGGLAEIAALAGDAVRLVDDEEDLAVKLADSTRSADVPGPDRLPDRYRLGHVLAQWEVLLRSLEAA